MSETSLFTLPRPFKQVKFHRHTDRTIGWLELFYDLVYVATLIQIGNFLSDNLTLEGFAQFLILMTVVWWSWVGETFYENRYVVDDLFHRILVGIQMFAVATIGLSVSGAFGELYLQFTIAYVVARIMLVIMYIRIMRVNPETSSFAFGRVVTFQLGAFIWVASLLLPAEYRWCGWLVAMVVELIAPLLPFMHWQHQRLGMDVHHIAERFGIFTIIVLGESFVKILDDAQGTTLGLEQMMFSTFGLLVLYSLWWLYFSETAGLMVHFEKRWKPAAWIYGHLPLAVGLVAFGVGAKKLFSSTVSYPGAVVNPDYRLLYMASLVFYLVALSLIELGLDDDNTGRNQLPKAILHFISAAIILGIGFLVTGVTTVGFVALMAVVMVTQVGIDIARQRRSHHSEVQAHH